MTTATITYTDHTGAPLSAERAEQCDRYAADLLSGRVFALSEMSARSVRCYEPPITSRDYSTLLDGMAQLARHGDQCAALARAVVPKINLYGTPSQACASVWGALFAAVKDGYTDVIGRSGPEGGRWSSYEHPYSLRALILAAGYAHLATRTVVYHLPGPGWALAAVARANRVTLPECR